MSRRRSIPDPDDYADPASDVREALHAGPDLAASIRACPCPWPDHEAWAREVEKAAAPEPRPPSPGWEREWAYVQERANAPRTPMLGCSTVSHERLGFCAACVRGLRDGGPNGSDLELAAWRLLALRDEVDR